MNFILGLPKIEKNKDSIFVVIDRFSKMTHFVPCNEINNDTHIGELYFKEVTRLHGIPKSIIFDRDRKFLSHFWVTLWKKLGTKLVYSSTCHSQTDGKIEVTNRTLGCLLRAFIKPHAKAWDLLLPYAMCAPSKATGLSPLKVVHGIGPLCPLDLTPPLLDQKPCADAVARVKEIQKLHGWVRDRIEKTNLSY